MVLLHENTSAKSRDDVTLLPRYGLLLAPLSHAEQYSTAQMSFSLPKFNHSVRT